MKIFNTLKHRGMMFKSVAKEREGASYTEKVDEMSGTAKGQQSTKSGGPSPRGAEVFGRKDLEAKRLAQRKITPRNIVAFVMEWSKNVRVDLTDFMVERFDPVEVTSGVKLPANYPFKLLL
jgi:hypothetical protein